MFCFIPEGSRTLGRFIRRPTKRSSRLPKTETRQGLWMPSQVRGSVMRNGGIQKPGPYSLGGPFLTHLRDAYRFLGRMTILARQMGVCRQIATMRTRIDFLVDTDKIRKINGSCKTSSTSLQHQKGRWMWQTAGRRPAPDMVCRSTERIQSTGP